MAPEEFSADIGELYEQLQAIPEFENEACRKAFPGFLDKVQHLYDFNQVKSYRADLLANRARERRLLSATGLDS